MMEQNKIPGKFMNDDGTVNTDAIIKSYSELEKKLGTMISIPDDDDNDARAKFNRAIGVPDNADEYPVNDLFDDDSIRTKFLDAGLTKNQVEKIYSIAEEFLSPMLSELFQTGHTENSIVQLRNYFGDDAKMKDALNEINLFGEKFLPTDAFDTLCATPQGIIGVHKMMQSMEPHVTTEKNAAGNLSDNDLRRMMRDPKYWRDGDSEYVRKIENGFKKLYA
jgi:hypothetical protein